MLTKNIKKGTATNDAAIAGNIGEEISAVLNYAGTALTTATPKTITSISLTPGDWDVSAIGYFSPAGTTAITAMYVGISPTNNTLDTTTGMYNIFTLQSNVPSSDMSLVVPPLRISLASTTTYYLVQRADFTVSTMTGWGKIKARRVR